MILNVLQAVIACFTLIKTIKDYRKLKLHYQTLLRLPLNDVAEVAAFLKEQQPHKKFLTVVKGIAKATKPDFKSGTSDKNIFSLVSLQPLTNKVNGGGQASFRKIKWEKIIQKYFWRRPKNLENISFSLRDMSGDCQIDIKDCSNCSIGGALTRVYSDRVWFAQNKNIVVKYIKYFYTFLTNLFPLNLLLKKIKLGQDISYYGILDGQYILAVGEVFRDAEGALKMYMPHYISKQKAFLTDRIAKRLKVMEWVQVLLLLIQLHAVYELIKIAYKMFKKRAEKKNDEQQEQKRSEGQGDLVNCIICYTNIRSIALKPCRHYGFCRQCFQSFKDNGCPICKKNSQKVKIYNRKNVRKNIQQKILQLKSKENSEEYVCEKKKSLESQILL